MKALLIILLISTALADRQKKHNEAIKALSETHFFHKGRGMAISPNMIKLYDTLSSMGIGVGDTGILNKRWGIILGDNKIKGIFSVPYKKMKIGVLGCVACHSGKAAGQYIVGLGNKNIDVGQIGKDTHLAQKIWGPLSGFKKKEHREMHKRAQAFTKGLSDKNLANETQGLVPTSLVRSWFYKVSGLEIPKNFPKGQVKVPHMWGYGEKRKSGSFWDGEANGVLPGWGAAVELYAGQTPENVREYEDKLELAEQYLGDILPPKYPFSVNIVRAQKGKVIFQNNCMGCHGSYERDSKGLPIFKSPKHIPLRIVKTDSDRLRGTTKEFFELIDKSPIYDLMRSDRKKEKGYIAPRLWGVWSRFPYLHNGSVASIMDLLTTPDKRRKRFSLYLAGEKSRFDQANLGLTTVKLPAKKNIRGIYETSRVGHSNQGHFFPFMKNYTRNDKTNLIEYLKTL